MSTTYYAHNHLKPRAVGVAEVRASGADQSFYTTENAGSHWAKIRRFLGDVATFATIVVGGFLLLNAAEGSVTPDYQNEQFQPLYPDMNPSGIQRDPVRMNPYQPIR